MRYMGNKTKLLEYIDKEVSSISNVETFFDVFAGTGVVGDYFKNKYEIVSNDMMFYSFCLNKAKLSNKVNISKMIKIVNSWNEEVPSCEGIIFNNFQPTKSERMYFSEYNAKVIDGVRIEIEELRRNKKINSDERLFLIAILLESVSKVSNVAGVYGAFLRKWDQRALKKIRFDIPKEYLIRPTKKNIVLNDKSENVIREIKCDVAYLDPPYTTTQYASQYHLLETIAKYDAQEFSGISGKRNYEEQKSDFSIKRKALVALNDMIRDIDSRYIILSYNSNGILSDKQIIQLCKRYSLNGKVKKVEIDYSRYSNSRSEKKDNTEFLFVFEKTENPMFISPINYSGIKKDLISFLSEHLENEKGTVWDLFGGSSTVSGNVNAKHIVYNEINYFLKDLVEYLYNEDTSILLNEIDKLIKKYNLSKMNKEEYYHFRTLFNEGKVKNKQVALFLLICFSFQHQLRFNSNLEYNNPKGNSGYNISIEEKIVSFCSQFKRKKVSFTSRDFEFFEKKIKKGDVVYCDPPYLITLGEYQDGKRGFNGWDENDEIRLLAFLDRLDKKGVKFVLSNVMEHNGKTNVVLQEWLKGKGYKKYEFGEIKRNKHYRNEVIITNEENS